MTSDERICVAGIDAETFEHVRPVTPKTDLITRKLLRENDGPFGAGAVVDLGGVEACPSPSETEDHRFQTTAASHIEDLSDDEYMALLEEVQDEDIPAAFGPELIEVRPGKLAVPAGEGSVSLGVVEPVDPRLEVSFENLYLTLEGPTGPREDPRNRPSASMSPTTKPSCESESMTSTSGSSRVSDLHDARPRPGPVGYRQSARTALADG
jgi:hypothetical protein